MAYLVLPDADSITGVLFINLPHLLASPILIHGAVFPPSESEAHNFYLILFCVACAGVLLLLLTRPVQQIVRGRELGVSKKAPI